LREVQEEGGRGVFHLNPVENHRFSNVTLRDGENFFQLLSQARGTEKRQGEGKFMRLKKGKEGEKRRGTSRNSAEILRGESKRAWPSWALGSQRERILVRGKGVAEGLILIGRSVKKKPGLLKVH